MPTREPRPMVNLIRDPLVVELARRIHADNLAPVEGRFFLRNPTPMDLESLIDQIHRLIAALTLFTFAHDAIRADLRDAFPRWGQIQSQAEKASESQRHQSARRAAARRFRVLDGGRQGGAR